MRITATGVLFLCAGAAVAAETSAPSVEAFARLPDVAAVTISPDNRYLAYISSIEDMRTVVVQDRTAKVRNKVVLTSGENHELDISWCRWANATRLLCGVFQAARSEPSAGAAGSVYPFTRVVGVNADGSELGVLIEESRAGIAHFQDRIVDWTPKDPDTVLIQLDDDRDGYPSAFQMNVYDGGLVLHTPQHKPIRSFLSDGRGEIRLGLGREGSLGVSYFGRLPGEKRWRRLQSADAPAHSGSLIPLAVAPGGNKAFALAAYEGRQALWEIDLEDKTPARVVFNHPQVDVQDAVFGGYGRLLGVRYDTDKPAVHYTDKRAASVIAGADKFLADTFNSIHDVSLDQKVYIIRTSSDVDAGTFHLLDVSKGTGELEAIGAVYPQLRNFAFGRMRSIEYRAGDGTAVPGYLTVPHAAAAKNLPLIVMLHGSDVARVSWQFDSLRAFLVSRGYAVLQMNARGSVGYGRDWLTPPNGNSNELTHSDIRDGARWVVSQGIADPARICILGRDTGGYQALMGAVRSPELYRCAVSIAGISDPAGLYPNSVNAESALRHAGAIRAPVLLVHGDNDWVINANQSRDMAAALEKAGKRHELLVLRGADHDLGWRADRIALFSALERFLVDNLRGAATE